MRKCIIALFLFLGIFSNTFSKSGLDSLTWVVHNNNGLIRAEALFTLCTEYHKKGIRNDSSFMYAKMLRTAGMELNEMELESMGQLYEANHFYHTDSTRFRNGMQSAIDFAIKASYDEAIVLGYLRLAIWFHKYSQYNDAIDYYNRGFAIAQGIKLNKRYKKNELLTKLNVSISSSYRFMGLTAEAAKYALEGSRLAIDYGYAISELKSYVNLSSIYGDLSTNDLGHVEDQKRYLHLSRQYLIKAYELSQLLPDENTRAICTYNLGTYYSIQEDFDSSNFYLDKAEGIGKRIKFIRLLCNTYWLKGVNFKENENYDSALFYLSKSLNIAIEGSFNYLIASVIFSKADVFIEKNVLDSALYYSHIGSQKSKDISSLKLQARAYEQLSRVSYMKEEFKKSLEYYKQYDLIQDSIANSENYAKIEQANARYEAAINEKKLSDLEKTNKIQSLTLERQGIIIAGGIVVFVLLVSSIYFYLTRRLNAAQEKNSSMKQKLLRSQMNPHFIFNALSSIRGYLYEDKDLHSAIEYLTKFSKLMRMTLEHTSKDLITLEEELAALKLYLEIQQMRFKAKFDYSINGLQNYDMSEILVPPLLAQPFVENSIEHGFRDMMTSGKIEINCKIEADQLSFHIEDNGVGIKHDLHHTNHESKALKIFSERIEMLGRKMKSRMEYTIQDLRLLGENQGTRIKYNIPLNTKLS